LQIKMLQSAPRDAVETLVRKEERVGFEQSSFQ
jgi:hypothetical protein